MLDKIDKVLFYIILALIFIGIVFVFSSSYYAALNFEVSPYYFSIRQIVWAGVSIIAMLLFASFDYIKLKNFVKPLVAITIVLLILVFIPVVGKTSGGARRWLDLRIFDFNPSELAKLTVIVYLSYILTKKQGKLTVFTFGLLPPLLLVTSIFFVILMQSGFSTAVVLLFVAFLMFFVGGASIKHIGSMLILSVPVLVFFIFKVAYRLDRIFAYLNPWEDMSGRGYHLVQSFKAFANGGVLGMGLGNGIQKMRRLPTPHTDFIFAVIAEEMGLVGCVVLMGLFFVFFIRGMMIAFRCEDNFGRLLAFGIVSLITVHALLNIGIATGLVPPTGVSLPFISYGGSSMLMMAVGSGILLNISKQNPGNNKISVKDVEDIIQEGFGY
jgi:cell division protein FtsW